MNLFLNGQPMQDEQMLSNYNVLNQTTIDMDIGLVGGKVHGSLARAGKVKGQTPKVNVLSKKVLDTALGGLEMVIWDLIYFC